MQSLEEKEWKQLPVWEFLDGVRWSPWPLKEHHPSCGKQVMINCPLWISHKERCYDFLHILKLSICFALTLIDLIDPTPVLCNQCFSDLQTKSMKKHISVSTSSTIARNWRPKFPWEQMVALFQKCRVSFLDWWVHFPSFDSEHWGQYSKRMSYLYRVSIKIIQPHWPVKQIL